MGRCSQCKENVIFNYQGDNYVKKKDKRSEYAFVGCMFIGMGIGYYIGNLLFGMFIGMGVGFLSKLLFYKK